MLNGSREYPGPFPRWLKVFGWSSLAFFFASQVFAVVTSPPDRDMGQLQKIMYVHVPAAWVAGVAFTIVFVYSLLYLWRRNPRHDLAAAAAAETGTLLAALTTALGAIWGRPTWGVWWTWDPRLTTTAIVIMIFAGYLALRAFTDDEERRARWSAAVGIFGFINVPVVYMSVVWWRTIHQMPSSADSVDSPYWRALLLNSVAFLALFIFLVSARYHQARLERALEARAEDAALNEASVHV